MDGIDLMLAGLNQECGRKVPRETLLLLRDDKLSTASGRQLERYVLVAPAIP